MQLGHYNFLSSHKELSTDAGDTPLAGSATANGRRLTLAFGESTRGNVDTIGKPTGSLFRAFASSDVAGTLNVQQSQDGQRWFTTDTHAIAADFTLGTVIEAKVTLPYVRAQLVNGSGAQTEVEFESTLVSI